jgi:hypothetical protein
MGRIRRVQEKKSKIRATKFVLGRNLIEEFKNSGNVEQQIAVPTLEKEKKETEILLNAIEKQLPKKPINQSVWKSCPTCEQGIGVTPRTINPKAIGYCYHCGQKLDWN